MASQLEVVVARGVSPAVSAAAAAAAHDRRFLTASWFGSGDGDVARTLLLRAACGSCLAAIPVTKRGFVGQVPGSYWPFRSFPVAQEVSPAAAAAALRSAAGRRALGLAVRIGPVLEDDPALLLLKEALDLRRYRLLEREVGRCFVHDVAELLREGPWPHASAVKRNGRRERQLAERGALRWEFVRGSAWSADLFDRLAAIEQASWLGDEAAAADFKFSNGPERRRWERLASDPQFAEYMSLCLLSVGERPVAFSFDLDVGPTRFGIASGYDRDFHQQSPGRLLHYRNTEDAIARGIKLINWGCGDSGYKRQLGAVPGPRLVDCLIVRRLPILERLAARAWLRG